MRVVAGEASTSRGGGERLERRGSRGRRRGRPALASEPQLAVLFLVLDHVRQVAEEVLAVAAYQDVRNICRGNSDRRPDDFEMSLLCRKWGKWMTPRGDP